MVLFSPYNPGIKWHYPHFIDEETMDSEWFIKCSSQGKAISTGQDMKSRAS